MLQQALTNIRAAIVLRDCAASTPSPAERRFFVAYARIYEARAQAYQRLSSVRGANGFGRAPVLHVLVNDWMSEARSRASGCFQCHRGHLFTLFERSLRLSGFLVSD
ncbi:MAG: hypothetical protein K2Y56_08775, partial [Methylobacterium sp.]|uniref:hypothetical protein n=1 Tax=Methylobacterium sp. TaxID=409 RepID=UPI0025DCF2D4